MQSISKFRFLHSGFIRSAAAAPGRAVILSGTCDPGGGLHRFNAFPDPDPGVRRNHTKDDNKGVEETTSKSSQQILKSWVSSIVGTKPGIEGASKKQVTKRPAPNCENYTTRHSLASEEPEASTSVSSSVSKGKRTRRRLSDNMWTTEPLDGNIIWVDCEMTGLDVEKDQLMEIGIIITDPNLKVIAQQDSVVFHVDEPVLQGMGEWCQKHHGESGLIDSARKSTLTFEKADEMLLKFVQAHTKPGECPMAGNSIGQDRMFIRRQLPNFYAHFHYRSVDVSTIKELVRRWYPEVMELAPKKKFSHRVLDDIRDSIQELQFYRSSVFAPREEAIKRATDENAKVKAKAASS